MQYRNQENILSHPKKKLLTHLNETAGYSRQIAPNKNPAHTEFNYEEIANDVAILHDYGKLTQFFQKYIHPEDEHNGKDALSNHSQFGAVVALNILSKKYSQLIGLASYIAIKNHHGYLHRTIDNEGHLLTNMSEADKRKRQILSKQFENIIKNTPKIANKVLYKITDSHDIKTVYDEFIDNKKRVEQISTLPNEDRKHLYEITFTLWNTLITADKLSAADLYEEYGTEPDNITIDRLNKHIEALQSDDCSQLNKLREKAREEALEWSEKYEKSDKTIIHNLSLPTGFGKTFTGLSAALKKQEQTEGNIIYALPFTSIIDQVDDDIQSVFNVVPTQKEYTVHHYLSETKSELDDKTDKSSKEEYLLAKTWDSPLVLTTFVQLFESLAAPTNSQGLKIPSLKDSIIILDEPQALSYDWWRLIPKLSDYLATVYDATIISMTATQPTMFKVAPEVDSVNEILQSKSPYLNYLTENQRVKYEMTDAVENYLNHGAEETPNKYDKIATQMVENHSTSTAAICNTISSARLLTDCLTQTLSNTNIINKSVLKSKDDTQIEDHIDNTSENVIHLTTRITPFDRKQLIRAIRYCAESNISVYVISTQLIEAGVDVSFEQIYRDIAPIPSIVQAAGRCNRNGEADLGTVQITRLGPTDDDVDTTPSALVYNQGLQLLNATRNTLKDTTAPLSEIDMIQSVTKFYHYIQEDAGQEEYAKYIEAYNMPELATLSLIQSRETVDIAICNEQIFDELFPEERNFESLSTGQKVHIEKTLEKHAISYPIPYDDEAEQRLRNNIGINLGQKYYIPRFNTHYDSVEGFTFNNQQPNQFI